MRIQHRVSAILVAVALSAVGVLAVPQAPSGSVERRIHMVAGGQNGAQVTDLAVADFTLKDGGKQTQITAIEKSRDRLKVAVLVDEILTGDTVIRQSIIRFAQRVFASGDVALYFVGRRNEKLVGYTSELGPFVNAVNAFPVRPQYIGGLVEAVSEIAKEQRTVEGRRAIVVVAPEVSQLSNVPAQAVLDLLRDNRAVFYAATVARMGSMGGMVEQPSTRLEGGDMTALVERDRVLDLGPKQSGGLRLASNTPEGIPGSLDRIAGELLNQYAVTYTLPAGTKSDGKVSLDVKRKGITLRAPTQTPKLN